MVMQDVFDEKSELVLMEAAVVEPLRRGTVVKLDPLLVHGGLIYDENGQAELSRLYRQYASIAMDARIPCLLCTPTWRTNYERVNASQVGLHVNQDAVKFLLRIRDELPYRDLVKIGGLIGCRNDGYQPSDSLSVDEARSFHRWQIEELAAGQVDFLFAATLPAIDEARGIARAMAATEKPYMISFVIDRHGKLLDGTPLVDAVQAIDTDGLRKPFGYMVNCAYPTFLRADQQPPELFRRLIGIQANASSLDHSELDCASALQMNDIAEWGEAMLGLHAKHGLRILGGCCGTNQAHLQYIVEKQKKQNEPNVMNVQ